MVYSQGIFLSGLISISFLIPFVAKAEHHYGSETCIDGYVWREAVPGDKVCVLPEIRSQAREDNEHAESRRQLSSPEGYCINGYVWREAVPGDKVCVLPETRSQAREDNERAESRWVGDQKPDEPEPNTENGSWWTNLCLCTDTYTQRTIKVKVCMVNSNGADWNCGFVANNLSRSVVPTVRCRTVGIERNSDNSQCDPQTWNWEEISQNPSLLDHELAKCRNAMK